MNKVFIALAIYGFAVAYGQPAHNQCEVQTSAALNLANLVERVSKGEGKKLILEPKFQFLDMFLNQM